LSSASQAARQYVDQKFGIKINWDSRVFIGAVAPPNSDPNLFAPTGFDYNQWLDAAVDAGAKYVVIMGKHHVGFAMWPTAYHVTGYAPYSIAQSDWYTNNGQQDTVGLLVAGCRTRGLNPCIYFSIVDYTYEARSGTTAATGGANYRAMIEAQLTELLTDYGDITAIWLDGWDWLELDPYIPYPFIANVVKTLQPNCLIVNNSQDHPTTSSEVECYEVADIPDGNTRLSEKVASIRSDGQWIWRAIDDPTVLKSSATVNAAILHANQNEGSYLLAILPDDAGNLSEEQLAVLSGIVVA
jgi:alpha-L-fucosidase